MLRVNVSGEGSCYFNVCHRKWTAMVLLNQAYRLFSSVDIYKHLKDLRLEVKKIPISDKFMNITSQIDTVLDSIKLICCFESAFKAELLNSGYLIHIIDNKKQHGPRKVQKKRPIKIHQIKRIEKVAGKRNNDYVFDMLMDKTIAFSTFLTIEGYKKELKYPDTTYTILKRINRTRNTLHFINQMGASYGENTLDDYEFIREIVERKIVKKHNLLVQQGKKFGYSTYKSIKI